jgi:hypothetical protein
MANKPAPAPLSKLVDKALESTVGLLVVFIISTALIGGMGYILFESRVEGINLVQENIEFLNSVADNSSLIQLVDKFSVLTASEGRRREISSTVIKGLHVQFNSDYVEAASKWCKDTAQKYMRLKPEIEAMVFNDQLQVHFQSSIIKLIDFEVAELDLFSTALTNWNKASVAQRADYYTDLANIDSAGINNANAASVQAEQITQEVANTTRKVEQQLSIMTTKFEMWRTRRDLAPIGIVVGLLTLFGLFVLLLYKVRHK